MPMEERIYRLRCVEAWSMVIPWSGFALRHLVDMAEPTSDAKYLVAENILRLIRAAIKEADLAGLGLTPRA